VAIHRLEENLWGDLTSSVRAGPSNTLFGTPLDESVIEGVMMARRWKWRL